MEPEEMNEFSKQMQESGEGRGGESLTNISLAISILAVLVAMVTVLGHRSHTDAVLSQAKASDMWNEYQAKRIRSTELAGITDMLTLQPSSDAGKVDAKIKTYQAQQEKWKEETRQEQEKALDFESDVRHAEKQATRFDVGEALLQIAVVLCSVTLFTRRRLYFYCGLGVGLVGLLFAATGFLVGT